MTSPSRLSARARARSDFPVPVGPTTVTRGGPSDGHEMTVTLCGAQGRHTQTHSAGLSGTTGAARVRLLGVPGVPA